MGKYCSLGKYNNQYKYILLYLLFKFINLSIYNFNYYDIFNGIQIFSFNGQDFINYNFIRQIIISYFGTFIFSCIFIFINIIKTNLEQNNTLNKERISANAINLIHEDNKEIIEQKDISFYSVLVIIFALVFQEQAIEMYNTNLCHLEFWMFELLIIAYFNSKILHIDIYRHQKFVLFFSLIPILFKIASIYVEFNDNDKHYPYEIDLYWIPLGLIIYFILITIRAYSITKIKCLMDLKYISEYNILMIYGLIGICFYSIFSIISSLTDYSNTYIFINKNNGFYEYFNFFSGLDITQKLIEILALVSGMITSYIINYNFMMIIKYLTPIHIVFLLPNFYFFGKLVLIIYNIIYCSIINDWSHFFGGSIIPLIYEKFTLDVFQDIFSLFGFLIYLEIIELNCFGLNYNLREKIIKRGNHELFKIDDCESSSSSDDNINDTMNTINSDDSIGNIINANNNSNISY